MKVIDLAQTIRETICDNRKCQSYLNPGYGCIECLAQDVGIDEMDEVLFNIINYIEANSQKGSE
jgi:hypothetical protein